MFWKSISLAGLMVFAVSYLTGCGGSSASPSVHVTASAATVDGTGTVTLTATVTNDTGSDGVTWSVSGAASTTLTSSTTSSVTFTAPAATASAQTVTITATSIANTSETNAVTLTVPALLASTTTTTQLTDVVGTVYSQQLTVSGGISPYTWTPTLVSGSLPAGWTISTSGVLSGPSAPTSGQSGTYNFTVAVKDTGTYSTNLSLTVTINPAVTITFGTAPTATGTFNVLYTSVASATGGAGALTYTLASGALPTGLNPINSSNGAITGTPTVVGTFNFKVTASDNFGDSVTSPQYTIVVSAASQTINFPAIAAQTVGTPLSLSATASSSLPVSFASTAQSICTVAGTTATFVASGTCTIQATQAGNTTYAAAPMVPQSFIVNGEAQTITFGTIASQAVGTPLTLSATASSTLAVSFASTTQSVCTVAGTTATFIATGTCTIQATQSGNSTYAAATMVPQSFTVEAEGQTINFPTIVTQTVGTPLTLSATASSNLAVSFASTTQTVCTVAGTTATFIASGSCTIQATQAGNTSYAAAPMVPQSFTVNGEAQSITFNNPTAQAVGELPLTLSASASSNLAVSFASTTPTICTVVSGKASFIAVGTCTIQATQTGNTTYAGATMVPQSFAVNQGAQSITFNNPGAQIVGTPLPLVATSNSAVGSTGLTVSFASTTQSVCTVAGTTATFIASGACTIQATQAGSANYAAATMVPQSFTVNGEAQTITFPTITTQTVGTPLTLAATASSTLAVSFASTTQSVCTVASTTATFIASGSCTIQATQLGNTTYAAATMVPQSFTVNGEAQTINFANPGTQYQATPLALSASATSTLAVSFASTTQSVCTVAGTTATFIASGTCTIDANQAGNTVYAAATMVPQSFTVEGTLAITTASPLPNGVVGNTYSQTLVATGGTGAGTYTWSVPLSADQTCLTSLGLTLSSAGVLSSTGALTSGNAGSCTSFGVQVIDNLNHTVSKSFYVTVSNFAITIGTPPPAFAVTGSSYSSGTFTATGGTGPYSWTILVGIPLSPGTLPTGLSLGSGTTATNSISGTVSSSATTGAYSLTVKVVDTNGLTATYPYTLTVYAPLSLTAPSSTVPGPAFLNTAYTGSTIYASGGSGNYSWSLNSSLPPGWSYSNPTGNSLVISGIASYISTSETMSFFVTLTDTTTGKTTGQIGYNILVGPVTPLTLPAAYPTSLPSAIASTSYSGAINASGGSLSGYVWSINGSAVPINGTAFSLSDGLSAYNTGGNTLSISGPLGSSAQTITLTNVTVTDGAGDNAGPVTYTITVNPVVPTGYTVSGTVNYTGTNAGWVYLELIPNNGCSGCNQNLGTAIDGRSGGPFGSPIAYTIHGVPAGSYNLQAYMDGIALGFGIENASDPTGSLSNLNVTSSGLSNQNFTLHDPAAVSLGTLTPTWDPSQGSGVFSGGAAVSFDPICNGSGCNNGGIEMPTSYFLQYSTDSTFNSGVTRKCFLAQGGNSPWIVSGLTNGLTYYFRAAAYAAACTNTPTALTYSAAEPSGGLLINAPSVGSSLSGTVTFAPPAGVTLAGGPLYVGCYASGTLYAERIASPVSPQAYSVTVPNGTSCLVFGFLDQFSSGLIGGAGELSNTSNGVGMIPVTVNGATPNQNITLPSSNSVIEVKTQASTGSNGASYGVGFQVYGEYKLPVAVELLSETPNVNGTVVDVVLPADIATDAFNNYNNEFDYWPQVTGTPVVGDTYTFKITYSDGSIETQNTTAAITGVLTNAFATSLSPTGSGVSLTPNFSWVYPSNASSYLYQFELNVNNGNTIWAIPPQHSSSNGFASTMTPFITWDVDPTNSGDLPSSSYLSNGGLLASTTYNWSIAAYDANMNEAQVSASFTTSTASLSLPVSSSGSALINTPYEQSLNASGGLGTDTFTVNGTSIPTNGINNAVSIASGDGLKAFSSGNQLTVFGTPTAGPITLIVSVTDGTNTTQQTYTITVASLPTPGAGNAYNAKLNGTYVCKSDMYQDSDGSRWTSLSSIVTNGSGGITSGVWDMNSRDLTSAMGGTVTSTSSYNVGADNNGVLTINTTQTIGGSGTNSSQFAIALNDANGATPTATEFRMVEIDDVGATPSGMHGSGDCFLATTGAFVPGTLSGNGFAFGMQGENGSGTPKAEVGRMTLSTESSTGGTGGAAGGTITSGIVDGMRLDQTVGNGGAFTGSYTVPNSTTGRLTLTFNPGGSSSTFVAYIIDANRMFLLEIAGDSGVASGDMRKQQQSANTAAALLSGSSVLYSQRFDGNSSGIVTGYGSSVYQLSGTGTGTATVNASYDDDQGTYTAGGENGQTVAVTLDSTNPGRATFSPGGGGDSAFFYFFGPGSAFYLDLNGSNHNLQTGWLEAQTQTTFTNAAVAGDYLLGKLGGTINDATGELNLLSNGNITIGAATGGVGDFTWDQAMSGAYSWASTTYGTFTTGTGDKDLSCAVISSTKVICITNGSSSAEMMVLQQ
jgi:hypothetical protein